MKRFALLATAAATLAIPAGAMAASTKAGVVLSLQSHSVQVVNALHVVDAYTFKGKLAHVHAGSEIKFALAGHAIRDVHVLGATKTVTYYAHVVRSGSGQIVLGLSDGRTVSFAPSEIAHTGGHLSRAVSSDPIAHMASGVTLTLNLPRGTNVLVTETVAGHGDISISITIEPGDAGSVSGSGGSGDGSRGSGAGAGTGSGNDSGSGAGSSANDQQIAGIVTDIQVDSFGIVTDDASSTPMQFKMNPQALANIGMSPCDTVIVSYHQSAGAWVADGVNDNGSSDAGACDSDGTYYGTEDEYGPITSISGSSITINTDAWDR